MANELYDISLTLATRIATWPGDVRFSLTQTLSQTTGYSVNVGCLQMSIHTGTHVDAPYHFDPEGETSDQLNLQPFWGMAQVVTVEIANGALEPEDFEEVDLELAPRLLLHTAASHLREDIFPSDNVYPSVRLVETLSEAGIILLGTDGLSMDALTDTLLPSHSALYRQGISILEGLNLTGVPDGLYELVALPLKIEGGDGSPVRAVLRSV